MTAQTFLVEHYWPGVTAEAFRDAAGRLSAEAGAMDGITFLHSTLVPADETVFWLFSGREPDIRAASEQAGVPFARVLESLHEFGEQEKGDL